MKKYLILFALLFFTVLVSAQFNRNSNRNRRAIPNTRTPQKPPEFNLQKTIGLNIYDIEKALKKIGVKKSDDKFVEVTSVFRTFNKKNKELSRLNSFAFSEVKNSIEYAQKQTRKTRDVSFVQKAYKEMGITFKDLIKKLADREKQLDVTLQPLLSKKQFKKWKKYKIRVWRNKK